MKQTIEKNGIKGVIQPGYKLAMPDGIYIGVYWLPGQGMHDNYFWNKQETLNRFK